MIGSSGRAKERVHCERGLNHIIRKVGSSKLVKTQKISYLQVEILKLSEVSWELSTKQLV